MEKKIVIGDLIGIPYKENGRDLKGLDCYGLAIEVEKRLGKQLIDVWYENHDEVLADEFRPLLNIREVQNIKQGILLEMHKDGELHIGVALNETLMIHATINQGVRISRIGCLPVIHKYEVI